MVAHLIQFCPLLFFTPQSQGDYPNNFNSAPYITDKNKEII